MIKISPLSVCTGGSGVNPPIPAFLRAELAELTGFFCGSLLTGFSCFRAELACFFLAELELAELTSFSSKLKLSTKAAVFKRVSFLIRGTKHVDWEGGQFCCRVMSAFYLHAV